jgi:glycerate-2-kinase
MAGDHLLKSGAAIGEINTVRKHLSQIHGGNLAKYAYPSQVLGLVISDVPGDDLTMVASGPISLDDTSLAQAQAIAQTYGLPSLELSETPKEEKYFDHVSLELLANGQTAVEGMSTKAQQLGYETKIFSTVMSGLAKDIGPQMAKAVAPKQALMACGESQVVVTKPGQGGRNQDLALAAAGSLPPNCAIISAASDGKDNIDVAGALVDSEQTTRQLLKLDIDAYKAIADNQSFKTLSQVDGIFHIRKVTANVSDFVVVLRKG